MVSIFVLLLIVFLGLFYGPDLYLNAVGAAGNEQLSIAGVFIQSPPIRVVLASGIAFFMISIVIFSLLDRIAETIKFIIKPFAALLPLLAFLGALYRTFAPMLANFLPQPVAQAAGVTPKNVVQWANDPEFTIGILITLGAMLLFLFAYRALTGESDEVRALRAELARTRRALR